MWGICKDQDQVSDHVHGMCRNHVNKVIMSKDWTGIQAGGNVMEMPGNSQGPLPHYRESMCVRLEAQCAQVS